MITIRQIERMWGGKQYERLFRDLIAARPEGTLRAQMELGQPMATAAMGVVRLYELSQEHTEIYRTLLKAVLAGQQADGGWGDPMTTALCVRSLLLGRGAGTAVQSGLEYLAGLQKAEGIWPKGPIRRMSEDAYASGFVLFQLAEFAEFRLAVRFFDAVNWFETNEDGLDGESRKLWDRASARCRLHQRIEAGLWS
ncbi:MAG TPA: hypothetical protein VFE58_18355 [Tepidisphaeraceae bacterium]|jgi:hypothetical protein|nr:hypothetical protein [Tepidisphaeraceae bacterium]